MQFGRNLPMFLRTYISLLQGGMELDMQCLIYFVTCWAKCKYTELVVDASMEVSLEENVEKTKV